MASLARSRAEVVALVVLGLGTVLFGALAPDAVPGPLYLVGVVGGATVALHAIGIVLIYRTTRIINFAQIQMGAVAGLLFVNLVARRSFVHGVAAICPPCLPRPTTLGELAELGGGPAVAELLRDPEFSASFPPGTSLDNPRLLEYLPADFSLRDFAVGVAPEWLIQLNYWLSMLVAIAVAVILLWLVYMLIIRRFANAPKLVLTVVTIAVGFFLQQVTNPILGLFFGDLEDRAGQAASVAAADATLPVDLTFTWEPVVFSFAQVLAVLVTIGVTVAMIVFFRRNRLGLVLRGASENPDRARTLGVNVGSVTARAWLMAGGLSGLAAVLTVAMSGAAPSVSGYETFVRTLAAAVAGGLVSLPVTAAAAGVIGAMDQTFSWVFQSPAGLAVVLLAVIVVLLAVQRSRAGRAERDASAGWQASRELRPVPDELRGLSQVRSGRRVLAGLAALVVLGYPWFMSPSQIGTAQVTMVYAMVGLSLLVLTGWAGQISLGQMAFAALGAWVTTRLGLSLLPSLVVGGTAGALLAVLVGLPSLRLRGLHLAISTLAFGFAVPAVLFDPNLLGGGLGNELARPRLLGIDFDTERAFFYLVLILLALMVVAVMGVRRSTVARALIASKDNESAAMSLGINLLATRVGAFALSGFMAAVAGAVFAHVQHGADPAAYTADTSVSVFLMTLIGGLGSLAGPLLGALYLGTLRVLLNTPVRPLIEVFLNPGLGVILLLLFVPGGVVQGLYRVRDAWLARLAARFRIKVPSFSTRDVHEGVRMLPNLRASGGAAFVPERYRLADQWLIEARRAGREREREQAHV